MIAYVLFVICIVLLGMLCYYYRKKYLKLYFNIDKMLDELLSERAVSQSDLKEGEASALAGKMMRVQEKLNLEICQAKEEKESVKSLISNMSHQLRTPLSNVMMYQELLENQTLVPEKRSVFQRKLKEQTEKINWILQSLFKMVRLEEGVIQFDAEPHPVKETLRKAINSVYEKAVSKEIEIISRHFDEISLVHNVKWTAEALENILENAVKYSPRRSRIEISIKQFEMYSQIRISDQGIGIHEKEFNHIFKRFYRSREVQELEGSGIGLYLAKLILEKQKGYITIESKPGEGSSFLVFLQNCKN